MIMSDNSSTTINKWLTAATQQLQHANIGTARLDALVLLEDCLGVDRAYILAHPETVISRSQQTTLSRQLARRAAHEPLAYIRCKTEFYGRDFIVSPAVLEPRPESETMIEQLLTLPRNHINTVVDVGTGSGALAITAALELGTVGVMATDIDPDCLKVARLNCKKHAATVDLHQTDLIDGLQLPAGTVLLANLPYVPDSYQINQAAMKEPRLAIFGGVDGLDLFRTLFAQAQSQATPPTWVLTESLPFQHPTLAQIATEHGYQQISDEDFIQTFSLSAQPSVPR